MGRTIAILGLSGVGKTTLIASLKKAKAFQYLSASTLIARQKEQYVEDEVLKDELRLDDIVKNQADLIAGFWRCRDRNEPLAVLDAHNVIDTPNGLIAIEPDVFKSLQVSRFIFLKDAPGAILERRKSDNTRKRPAPSSEEIKMHQSFALQSAIEAARTIAVPIDILTPKQVSTAVALIQAEIDQASNEGSGV